MKTILLRMNDLLKRNKLVLIPIGQMNKVSDNSGSAASLYANTGSRTIADQRL